MSKKPRKEKTPCEKHGHSFVQVTASYNPNYMLGNYIPKVYCTKCGETKDIK